MSSFLVPESVHVRFEVVFVSKKLPISVTFWTLLAPETLQKIVSKTGSMFERFFDHFGPHLPPQMDTKIVQKSTFERLEALSVSQGGPRGPSDLILAILGVILEALGHMFGPFFGNFGRAWRQFGLFLFGIGALECRVFCDTFLSINPEEL